MNTPLQAKPGRRRAGRKVTGIARSQGNGVPESSCRLAQRPCMRGERLRMPTACPFRASAARQGAQRATSCDSSGLRKARVATGRSERLRPISQHCSQHARARPGFAIPRRAAAQFDAFKRAARGLVVAWKGSAIPAVPKGPRALAQVCKGHPGSASAESPWVQQRGTQCQ